MQRSGLADKADLRRTVRTVVAKFARLCTATKNAYGKFVCSSNRNKGESMITEINIEWMIRKKKAQIRKRKRETCNRIEFTFSVVSTYPHSTTQFFQPLLPTPMLVRERPNTVVKCLLHLLHRPTWNFLGSELVPEIGYSGRVFAVFLSPSEHIPDSTSN
jgi:hypothetical protein